jgi:hypothetical protein
MQAHTSVNSHQDGIDKNEESHYSSDVESCIVISCKILNEVTYRELAYHRPFRTPFQLSPFLHPFAASDTIDPNSAE